MRTQLSMRAPNPLLTLTISALCPYVCVPAVVTTTPAQWHRIAKGRLLDGPDPGGHPAPAEILEATKPWQALSEARTPPVGCANCEASCKQCCAKHEPKGKIHRVDPKFAS
jgi:hypothetical protein